MTHVHPVGNEPLVGVSVSEPPNEELIGLGMSSLHVRHTFIEVVRHVLAAGWSVAYGGDRRPAGYTEALFDLVRMYEHRNVAGANRVRNYLAWPVWVGRSAEDDAGLANVASLIKCAAPAGAPETLPPRAQQTPLELLLGSLALSAMRREMTGAISSRLVLGGRVSGQSGLVPGVVEEAVLAIRAGKPLYVAGGFGGCGRVVVAALEGARPSELTIDHQLVHTPRYQELLEAAEGQQLGPDFDGIAESFAQTGLDGLRNGLDQDDNRQLAYADDTEQVVALVMRGLHRIDGSGRTPT